MARSTKVGELVIEVHHSAAPSGNQMFIRRADERIRVAAELLEQIDPANPYVSYGDGILTIRAINGTVSYGIGPYDLRTHTHEGIRSSSWLDQAENSEQDDDHQDRDDRPADAIAHVPT